MDVSTLQKTSNRLLSNVSFDFVRDQFDLIGWNGKLILLKGFRGVGKTTLLLQYVKKNCDLEKSIVLSLDNIHFASISVLETVDFLYDKGYRTFVFDEVHRYEKWSTELKNIYDGFPDVQVLGTSSSALDIQKGEADLSRRADIYLIEGLSFAEYMRFMHGTTLPRFSFEEILSQSSDIGKDVYDRYNIDKYFTEYLKYGYYPFIIEGKTKYYDKIQASLNQTIDIDMPAIFNIDYATTRQVKKFLSLLSKLTPYQPNIASLARDLNLNRISLLLYIDYLESATVINLLRSGRKSDSILTKPDKILLNNTNLLFALTNTEDKGTVRETFIVNALKQKHTIATPAKGDILLDQKYTIEIGGQNKRFHQIADMANPVLILDGIAHGGDGIVPMWMLGLLN
jgi:uncharacterized protein